MKNVLATPVLALGLMFSGAALAGETKPANPATVDAITTQSVEPAEDATKCGNVIDNLKTGTLCGDGSAYPTNPMSGLNLN